MGCNCEMSLKEDFAVNKKMSRESNCELLTARTTS